VIDGIAVQEPGIKATGAQAISGGQPTPVNLKMPPTPGIGGIIQSQNITTSNVKFDSPPQGFAQKDFNR